MKGLLRPDQGRYSDMSFFGTHQPRRGGFGMLEIVILLGVAAVVGVLTVNIISQADRVARVSQTAEILDRVNIAIIENNGLGFQQRVGANPRLLSQLTNPIAVGDPNSCTTGNDVTVVANDRDNWSTWGPFNHFYIDATIGLVTPIGIANNTMVRLPTNKATGTLRIDFPSVDQQDLLLLDLLIDGTADAANGDLTWSTPAADGTTSASYFIHIANTC
jgi:hypothetical protein